MTNSININAFLSAPADGEKAAGVNTSPKRVSKSAESEHIAAPTATPAQGEAGELEEVVVDAIALLRDHVPGIEPRIEALEKRAALNTGGEG